MSETVIFQQLGLSLLLGLLVGIQRERSKQHHISIGVRTFPMVTIFGTVCAQISLEPGFSVWVVVGGMLCMTIVMIIPQFLYAIRSANGLFAKTLTSPDGTDLSDESLSTEKKSPEQEFGITTQISALLMFGVGVLMVVSSKTVAVSIGALVAILLHSKLSLHRFTERLSEADMKAIMQFVLITCIILPILPNQTYGPYDVFNPMVTWMLVVLIVGMGLLGYITYMLFGRNAGILLAGVLGGVISSTATTASYSRQAKSSKDHAAVAPIVIMIASSIAFIRVLIEITVISVEFFYVCLVPVLLLMTMTLLPALVLYFRIRNNPTHMPAQQNPAQLKTAITFAIAFTVVSFGLAIAKDLYGESGLYVFAAFSGITDMDAITLSTSRLAVADPSMMQHGWRLIIIGSLSNLVSKGIIIAAFGGRLFLGKMLPLFAIPFIGGILMLIFL